MNKLASTVMMVLVLALPGVAAAQSTVTILGLRSATADQPMATRITDALRQAADAAEGGRLIHSGRENDLNQMLLVFDCEEPDERCMQQIGESLNSDYLIYGNLELASGRSDSDYVIVLNFFNVQSGRVERTLREVIPRDISDDDMIEPIARYYAAVTGTVVTGELAIHCSTPGAHVRVDGREVGTTGDEPIVLRGLEPGEVEVEVVGDGYEPYRENVSIEAGQLRELEVALTPMTEEGQGGEVGGAEVAVGSEGGGGTEPPPTEETGRRSLAWLGWTFAGVTALSVGLAIWQGVTTDSIERDVVDRYGNNWPEGMAICDNVEEFAGDSTDEVNGLCDDGRRAQTLQFVFYGTAVATGAVALWLLIREYTRHDDGAEASRSRHLSVAPLVFRGGAALSAELSF